MAPPRAHPRVGGDWVGGVMSDEPKAVFDPVSGEAERPCSAWAHDMLATFDGARITYLKGPGVERETKGDEGVEICLRD